MTHNLMLLLERKIEREEGITDKMSLDKRIKRMLEDEEYARLSNREPNPLVSRCQRITQRSVRFVRWIRDVLTRILHE